MLRTVEATIDEQGNVSLNEPVKVSGRSRALVTILDVPAVDDVTLFSEAALAEWNSPEEEEAWAHLRSLPLLPDDPCVELPD
jgi:hypothetical protein